MNTRQKKLFRAARRVARELKTKHILKRHGGYDIYTDEKVVIALDTYAPNLALWIKMEGEDQCWPLGDEMLTCVFRVHGVAPYRATLHRRGRWERYVLAMEGEARAEVRRRKAWREMRRRTEHYRRFHEIDDEELFF